MKVIINPLIVLSILALTACQEYDSNTKVILGEFNAATIGAECTLKDSAGTILSTQITGADGTVSFVDDSMTIPTGLVTLSCTGGSYTDEATGNIIQPPLARRAAKIYDGGGLTLITSPPTEMAYQNAIATNDLAANITEQNKIIATAVGLDGIDITRTIPTDINTAAAQNDNAGQVGLILAAISQLSIGTTAEENRTADVVITELLADINGANDGATDNKISDPENSILDAIDELQTGDSATSSNANNSANAELEIIANLNTAPTLSGTPDTSVEEATNYSFTPTGEDADGDTLTYSITNKPTWASFDSATGKLTGTAIKGSTTGIIITVTDGRSSASLASFSIEVTNVNDAPTLTGTPATSVVEDTLYSFTPTGADIDAGETLTYSISNKPTWASFDSATGKLTGTPDNSHVGTTSNIVITVTDSAAASASLDAFDIEVIALPIVSITDTSITEGDSGTSRLEFTMTLDKYLDNASVDVATSDGTATASEDYIATTTIVEFTGNNTSETISITINGDTDIESDETFTVTLSNPSNLSISTTNGSATGTISNDDFEIALNDTGITWAGEYDSGNKSGTDCTTDTINSKQDCDVGRDADTNLSKIGAGAAGFDFTKLGATGTALATQNVAWSDTGTEATGTSWSCVKDNHTGLIWEIKTTSGTAPVDSDTPSTDNIHHKDNQYRWGGLTALGIDHANKEGTYYSDWDTLVNGSNSGSGLCGFTDWRVPNIDELGSIVHLGVDNLAIDTTYFPNTVASGVWSSSPDAYVSNYAWYVSFNNGYSYYDNRGNDERVRLVRSGE
jgi:hypothetical protein